jgi:hypothetical protein
VCDGEDGQRGSNEGANRAGYRRRTTPTNHARGPGHGQDEGSTGGSSGPFGGRRPEEIEDRASPQRE